MLHKNVRVAIIATAGAGLLMAGIATTASASPRSHHSAAKATTTATASYKAVITVGKKSDTFSLTGPKSITEGIVKISMHSKGDESDLAVQSFKGSYTMKDYKADITAFGASEGENGPTQEGLKHLRNAIKHVVAYGGLDATPGEPDTGEFLLNRTGTVYIYDDTGDLPADIHKITVKKSSATSKLPATTKKITMLTKKRFGGDKVLPAKGTITITNKSTESPHFLELQHVKAGTTRKQVLEFFESGAQTAPPFALKGAGGVDVLTTGESENLTYDLPKGEYIEVCFFPDPKTGMPHALMGMIGTITLK